MRKKRRIKNWSTHERGRWLLLPALVVALGMALAIGSGSYAAHLENNDAFCTSCHVEPESTYAQRTQETTVVDLATSHAAEGIHCIECHSGPGAVGRFDTMMTLGVGDLIAYKTGNYQNPHGTTRPIEDDNCLKCHADVATRRTFNNHFHLLLSRWQRFDPKNAGTCVDCHEGHVLGGDSDIAFLQEDPTVGVCKRCHRVMGE